MGLGSTLKGALGLSSGPKGSFTDPQELVKQQDLLNRYNINSAYGSRSFTTDPTTGRSVLNIQETPEQQQIRQLQYGQAINTLQTPATGPQDYAAQGNQIRDALFKSSLYNLSPQFNDQNTNLQDYLSNRGIGLGNKAYSKALTDLRRDQNNQLGQLSLQSTLAGTQEQDGLTRLAEAQRAARLAETGNALNGIDMSLFGNVSGIDAAGIISGQQASQNAYNLSNFQDTQKRRTDFTNGLIKGGFSLLGGVAASDYRLKNNIKKVGIEKGYNIYEFNYLDQPDKRYRGVMAQEVLEIMPQAVVKMTNGFFAVCYDMLGLKMKEV